ncbi:MAG TPA: universal stress protein [Steroidobacteraceae bacterium]|jgi:universal stress protein E|nr:universal stress protein [Steroidobacteraceae bacterium]
MARVRRILVALKDPAGKPTPALEKAAQLARANGARLELFHGITTSVYLEPFAPDVLTPERILAVQRRGAKERLEKLAARLRRAGVRASTAIEVDFPAHEAIIRRAARTGADLIVVDAHAGRRMLPALLQLTDWELLRHSRVPVLVVKGRARYRRPVVLAAVDPMHANAKPGGLDRVVLGAAGQLADSLRGELHVVHAYDPLPPSVANARVMNSRVAAAIRAEAREASKRAFARLMRGSKVPEARRHLKAQNPYVAIQQAASENRADVIVMGAISRSGIKRLLIGNTAERVLNELACDVLVVKPRGFRSRIPRSRRGLRVVANPMVLPY